MPLFLLRIADDESSIGFDLSWGNSIPVPSAKKLDFLDNEITW